MLLCLFMCCGTSLGGGCGGGSPPRSVPAASPPAHSRDPTIHAENLVLDDSVPDCKGLMMEVAELPDGSLHLGQYGPMQPWASLLTLLPLAAKRQCT